MPEYLIRALRDGYVIKSEHVSVPGWFQSLINDLIESGLY